MEQNGQDRVAAFDALFTNNRLQKLKVLMPFLDRSLQKNLAIYIKYLELQYTIAYFQKRPFTFQRGPGTPMGPENPLESQTHIDIGNLCDALFPYCTQAEKAKLNNLRSLFQSMTQFQEMMEMAEMMKDLFPEGMDGLDGLGFGQAAANTAGETNAAAQTTDKADDGTETGAQNARDAGFPFPPELLQMMQLFQNGNPSQEE